MVSLGTLTLHFLTSVCSKGQAFKTGLQNKAHQIGPCCVIPRAYEWKRRASMTRTLNLFLCLFLTGAERDGLRRGCIASGGYAREQALIVITMSTI